MANTQKMKGTTPEWEAKCAARALEFQAMLDNETNEDTIRFLNRQVKNWTKLAEGVTI